MQARQAWYAAAFASSLALAGPAAMAQAADRPAAASATASPAAAPAPADFSGVWQIVGYEFATKPEESDPGVYTDEARKRLEIFRKHYDETTDDPARFCFHAGMPWTMLSRARDYNVEIYQTTQRVILFIEGMDRYRHIRLDSTAFPEGYIASGEGYSIGHWEGSTLVIETRGLTAINAPVKRMRSDQARVIERWTFERGNDRPDRIHFDLTIEDPVIYRLPIKASQIWQRSPAGAMVGGYNCQQAMFEDYMTGIKEAREGKVR